MITQPGNAIDAAIARVSDDDIIVDGMPAIETNEDVVAETNAIISGDGSNGESEGEGESESGSTGGGLLPVIS